MSFQSIPKEEVENFAISKCWDICLQFEYRKDVILSGLEKVLTPYKDKAIIDCACGTGFLTLDLIRKGFQITCSDGSDLMLKLFRENAERLGLNVMPHRYRWSELGTRFPESFDLVLCRGSSLIYVDSWDQTSKNDIRSILDSIKSFHDCLKPGGTLYVDTTSQKNLQREEPEKNEYPERIINGFPIRFKETVTTDRANRVRIWEPVISVDSREYRLKRYSLYLAHDELIDLLIEAGFDNIRKVDVEGEHYDVFLADKPR